ncbi:MAG TPA: hypothetical protein VNS11_07330, partial [Sphingomicrobium sp.]|nr:hypothetical protein [Sphingomicrobium sp.]
KLPATEAALADGEVEVAATELAEFAEVVFETAPFRPDRGLPAPWKGTLYQWLGGFDLPPALVDPGAEIEFLQDGIVFRLVWAVEAVRVQGIAEGVPGAADIQGNIALALTYGVPSIPAILLAQAGLPSRAMIRRLMEQFPATFADAAGMRDWLRDRAEHASDLWAAGGERQIWRDFLARWREGSGTNWTTTSREIACVWAEVSPPPDTPVRLVHDPKLGTTGVYRMDLTRLGTLAAPLPEVDSGVVRAAVSADAAHVAISRFGPS